MFVIIESDPGASISKPLIDGLSNTLKSITGSDGRNSFSDWEPNPRAVFVVALLGDEPVGCGALRPVNPETAEVKRMYAKYPGKGIGTEILTYLEEFAIQVGYKKIWLETRIVNQTACRFYSKSGYSQIPNYGQYTDRKECICFEKSLI